MPRRRSRRRSRRPGGGPADTASASAQRRAIVVGLLLLGLITSAVYLVWRTPVKPLTLMTVAASTPPPPSSVPFAAVPDYAGLAGLDRVGKAFAAFAEANPEAVSEPVAVESGVLPGSGPYPGAVLLYAAAELTATSDDVLLMPPGGPPVKLSEVLKDLADRATDGAVVVLDRAVVPTGFAGQGLTGARAGDLRAVVEEIDRPLWLVASERDMASAVVAVLQSKTDRETVTAGDFAERVRSAAGPGAVLIATPAAAGGGRPLLADRTVGLPEGPTEPDRGTDAEPEPEPEPPAGTPPSNLLAGLRTKAEALLPSAVGAAQYHALQAELVAAQLALAAGDLPAFRTHHDAAAARIPAATDSAGDPAAAEAAREIRQRIGEELDRVRESPARNRPPRIPAGPGPRREAVVQWLVDVLANADESSAGELRRVLESVRGTNDTVVMPAEFSLAEAVLSLEGVGPETLKSLRPILRERRRLTDAAGLTGPEALRESEWQLVGDRVREAEASLRAATRWLTAGAKTGRAAEQMRNAASALIEEIATELAAGRDGLAASRAARGPWVMQVLARAADRRPFEPDHLRAVEELRMPEGLLPGRVAAAMRTVGGKPDGGPFERVDVLEEAAASQTGAFDRLWLPWAAADPEAADERADPGHGRWTSFWSIRSLEELGEPSEELWPLWSAVASADSATPADRTALAAALRDAWANHFAAAPGPSRPMTEERRGELLAGLNAGLPFAGPRATLTVGDAVADESGRATLRVRGPAGAEVYVRTAEGVELAGRAERVVGDWSLAGALGPEGGLEVAVTAPEGDVAEVRVLTTGGPAALPASAAARVAPSAEAEWDFEVVYAEPVSGPPNGRVPGVRGVDAGTGRRHRTLKLVPATRFAARLRLKVNSKTVKAARVRLLTEAGDEVAAAVVDVSAVLADVPLAFSRDEADLLTGVTVEVTPVVADRPVETAARRWDLRPKFVGPDAVLWQPEIEVNGRAVRVVVRRQTLDAGVAEQLPKALPLVLSADPVLRKRLAGDAATDTATLPTRDLPDAATLGLVASEDLSQMPVPGEVWLGCPDCGWPAGWAWRVPEGTLLSRNKPLPRLALPAAAEGDAGPVLAEDGTVLIPGKKGNASLALTVPLFFGTEWPGEMSLRVRATPAAGDPVDVFPSRTITRPLRQTAVLAPGEEGAFVVETTATPFAFDFRPNLFGEDVGVELLPELKQDDAVVNADIRGVGTLVDAARPYVAVRPLKTDGRPVRSVPVGQPFTYELELSDAGSGVVWVESSVQVGDAEPVTTPKDFLGDFLGTQSVAADNLPDEVPAGRGTPVRLQFKARDAVGNVGTSDVLEFFVVRPPEPDAG